jgi:hypothetical protein
MATLEEIRAKLLAQQPKSDGNRGGGDNSMYPFWNLQEGGQSFIRFLPDGDPSNTFFWVERLVIKLPFQGVKGEHDREVLVEVPCMEMYGETCPILAETRPWWKDDSLQPMARKYWKKKSYLFQGFVVNSGFEEKELPENPIRRFMINSSIYEIIKGSLMNPEMEDLPTDYVAGRDFKLVKTTKGGFANYTTSNWSFKTRSLSPEEAQAIETHGLKNLRDYLPAKPTAEQQAAIQEMFQASVNDEAYDPARWSQFYKPKGSFNSNFGNNAGGAQAAPQARAGYEAPAAPAAVSDPFAALQRAQAAAPAPVQAAESVSPPARPAGTHDASDILARIKAKQAGLNG